MDDTPLGSANSRLASGSWLASRDNSDVQIPVEDYYVQMEDLLRQYYVEPISNEQKLASGSVRGMIASLGDLNSLYMDPDQFKAYRDRQSGYYQGIGVSLSLETPKVAPKPSNSPHQATPTTPDDAVVSTAHIPRLVVSAVVPGGPADKAGVKVGDQVSYIDDHWVVDEAPLDKFRHMQRLLNEQKIKYADIAPLQRDLRAKTERALLPLKAADRLLVGKTGTVTVVWTRDGQTRTTHLVKTVTQMPGFQANAGTIRLPITQEAAQSLREALKGHKTITLDLRNDPEGDYEAIMPIMQALVPSGSYGEFDNERKQEPVALKVNSGNPNPPKIVLLVDRSTNGPAAIIAAALSSHGRATLKGSEMGSDLRSKQIVELADGSGYTLNTGEYKAIEAKTSMVAAAEEKR
jgi:carboxyl-terminal processing protease